MLYNFIFYCPMHLFRITEMPLLILAMPSLHTRLIRFSFLYVLWGCARAELGESFRKWHASYLNFARKPLVELWDHCHRSPLQLRYDMEPVRSPNLGLHVISFLCLGYHAERMLVLARSPYMFIAYKAQDLLPTCFLVLPMIVTTCTYINAPVLLLGPTQFTHPLLVMRMPLALLKQSFVNRAFRLVLASAVIATLGMFMLLAVNRLLNPSLVMLMPLEIKLQSFVIRVTLLVLMVSLCMLNNLPLLTVFLCPLCRRCGRRSDQP
ncbi:unnamed protein product [Prorocentrum cordatum]|uniref:Alpha-1,3-glucosyltransferase n=1 Tax=Prorocentrum cordatum TaxID=2364126 RepID=A0ABN9RJ43_9DINO|nr:unnamed protein product [Polarella glacialis]